MTAQERITEWAELAEAATEGPWVYLSRNAISTPSIDIDEADWGPEGHSGYRIHTEQDTGAWKYADAALMAASRTAVPAMAAALTAVLKFATEERDTISTTYVTDPTSAYAGYANAMDDVIRLIETALGATA